MPENSPTPFWSSPLPLPELPRPPVIIGDLPCRRCSYNLRTLASDAICPECGTPVALSMGSDWLHYSDPNWLRTLRIGAWLATVGLVVSILFGPIEQWISHSSGPQPFGIKSLSTLLGYLLLLTGAWLISTPDPSAPGADAVRRRQILRILTYVKLAQMIAVWIAADFPTQLKLLYVEAMISDLVSAAFFLALFRYLYILIMRIADVAKAYTAKLLALFLPLILILSAALYLLLPLLPATRFWQAIPLEIDRLAIFLLKLVAIRLIGWFARNLTEQIQAAEKAATSLHGV
jgi:hypothetical protein